MDFDRTAGGLEVARGIATTAYRAGRAAQGNPEKQTVLLSEDLLAGRAGGGRVHPYGVHLHLLVRKDRWLALGLARRRVAFLWPDSWWLIEPFRERRGRCTVKRSANARRNS